MDGSGRAPAATCSADAWTAAMRAEDFSVAWRIADQVLAERDPAGRDDPALPYHLRWVWDGTPPDGRDVLVRCYHGLGDTLQFVRFIPALRARAARVTLEAQPALCPLLAGLPGVDRLVAFDVAAPLPPSACDMEVMELAYALRVEAGAVSGADPYLRVAEPAETGAIGVCWEAGGWDASRSLPSGVLLAACAAPGRRFVSLQRGPASAEATAPAFVNPRDDSLDLGRTAALIAGAACVVTVDTMVAHLAGALGRPTIVLLKAEADWRWPLVGRRSVWYPTATIVRQARPGDWTAPLAELPGLLRRFTSRRRPLSAGRAVR